MLPRRRSSAPGDAAARRLRQALAEAGLVSGGHGRPTRAEGPGARLRRVLEGLGVVAAAFGRHLATRADLLSRDDRSALAGTTLDFAPLPPAVVRGRIAAELRARAAEVLRSLDETPLRSGVFHQRHAARTAGGDAVVLVLLRPEWDTPPDVAWLRGVAAAVPGADEAADDFARDLARRCDLEREARDLETLARHARGSQTCVVPRVLGDLSSARLLVQEALDGRPLLPPPGEGACTRDDARRVCAAFFGLALLDGALLEAPEAGDFRLLPGECVAVTGGSLSVLDDTARRTLMAWLSALAREEPDAACAALLRLTRAGPDGVDRHELRLRLRQAEPLRAGLGFERYQGRRLAHALGVQWRLARECGGRPRPELTACACATLALDGLAAPLAPAHDTPSEGLADVRLLAAATELRELLAPSRLTANVARYLPPLVELVQRADRQALADAREPEEPVEFRQEAWGAFWARLALVLAVALVAPRLLAGLGQPWDERLAAVALLAAGTLLLSGVRRAQVSARARRWR